MTVDVYSTDKIGFYLNIEIKINRIENVITAVGLAQGKTHIHYATLLRLVLTTAHEL